MARIRERQVMTGTASYDYYSGSVGQNHLVGSEQSFLTEYCEDQKNIWPPLRSQVTRNVGGKFYVRKFGVENLTVVPHVPLGKKAGGWADVRPGGSNSIPLPSHAALSEDTLWSNGAKVIAETSPTNPAFSLPVFLGELRQGLPHLIGRSLLKDQTSIARGAGKEYLNIEFGWKPLISDLRKLGELVTKSAEIRAQFIRDADRPVRRRWTGPSSELVSSGSGNGTCYAHQTAIPSLTTWTLYQYDSLWFSGAFRYHIPTDAASRSRWAYYELWGRRMLGLSVSSSPEIVWNLAPWSWLVDWHSDVGSFMTNLSNMGHDALRLQYGYLMNESTRRLYEKNVLNSSLNSAFARYNGFACSITKLSSVKQRVKASPFGFGLGEVDYSPRQLAILAALGLARDPNRMS